ncbi:tRNA adenosine(34) deaminase TadA, partial [Burkholderia sp. Cy-647]|nr:tRNA adenosine(34) deaminase TadA [Burkholderia sp. Cy-647]
REARRAANAAAALPEPGEAAGQGVAPDSDDLPPAN